MDMPSSAQIKGITFALLSSWSRILLAACLGLSLAASAAAKTTPGFNLSLPSNSLTLLAGGSSASSTVAVSDLNGFAGSVAFSVSGVPSGITPSFSTTSSAYKTTLTLKPGASAVPGTYKVTVTGTSGTLTSSSTIALSIPQPSFKLAASPSSLTALAGGSGVNSVISVGNEVGLSNSDVSLVVSGAPAGVTARLNWLTVGLTSTVTLTAAAGATVTPGTYPITITGTSGSATNATTIALTIPKPSFSLAASANALTLNVGEDGWNLPIDISVANPVALTARVSLAVSGLPVGVTSAFAAVNATTEGLTFKVASGTASGMYPVRVTGTSGEATSSTTIELTIANPTFRLSSSSSALTVVVGGASASSTITVNDQNGFTGNVAFSVSGAPSGVTPSFSSASSAAKTTLTLKPGTTPVPGTYTVTVTGTSGSLTSSATIALTIPQPSFTVSASSSPVTLVVGSSASAAIHVAGSNGSSSSVSLTASGCPAGVTAAFSPAVTSSASSITLTASNAAAPGTYTVTVTGTAGAAASATTVVITIPAPSFSITPVASTLTAVAGGVGANTTISVAAVDGFSSSVAFAASGLPSSVTAAFAHASTSTGTSLTLAAGSGAVPGTYTVTVTGTSGSMQSTATLQLRIPGPISIAITQPAYGFNVLPGSVRRIYATVANGITNGVNWSVTGGASLSTSSGNWVDVTAPSTGSSCSIQGTGSYTITSARQLTLTAQSQENPKQTAAITISVCNPAVQINVVPFYTTLYVGQKADVQAFVWGAVNHNVTWAITAEPNGGDGVLTDSTNQDAVFSATVAGRYTLTATSAADGTKTNTATVYVTGHSMAYEVTPSETEPVDCSVDPALTGKTYDVGPSQGYKTIRSVPWTTLAAGSTVRIHNEDTTGANPTTYYEYFQLATKATRTQPVRVCGVPDSRGNLPVIDASNAVGSSTVSVYSAGYAAVGIGTPGWAGVYTGTWTGSQYLIVEGLKIQNAKPPASYTTPAGAAGTAWGVFSACIRIFGSMNTVVRGIEAYNCGLGFFSDFNAGNGFAAVANTLYEGNHLHNNGISGSDTEHQMYIQGWNELVQFNIIDEYQSGASGSNFKSRGFPDIIRYNHFGDGAARELDLVDNQDAHPYTTFEGYLGVNRPSFRSYYPQDAYTADLLAAAVEAHHADFVYGNTFVNTTAGVPIHYASDSGSLEDDRIGTLWFYNNSFYEPVCNGCKVWRWSLFDTSGGGGDNFPEIEWPQIQVANNAIWMDAPKEPYFSWNNLATQFTTFGVNATNADWGTGSTAGGDGSGWDAQLSAHAFQGAGIVPDTTGVSNLLGVSAEPFNVTTFVPNEALINAGASLPAGVAKLPVRFQYGPSAIQTVRTQPLTLGAME
jgi:uncharacterized membrane protein